MSGDPTDGGRSEASVTNADGSRSPTGGSKLRAVGVAVGLLLAGLAVSLLFGVAFTIPLLVFGGDLDSPVTFLVLAAVGQLAFVVVGAAYLLRAARTPIGPTVRLGWPSRSETLYAVGGTLVALVVATGLSVVAATLGVGPTESVFDEPISQQPLLALGLAALSILLVAPAEELLFRGAIQGRLRTTFGPVGAVGGASLLFGSIHATNFGGSLVGAAVGAGIITISGLVFGVLYERTRNLVVPILAHASYNTVLLVAAFLSL